MMGNVEKETAKSQVKVLSIQEIYYYCDDDSDSDNDDDVTIQTHNMLNGYILPLLMEFYV